MTAPRPAPSPRPASRRYSAAVAAWAANTYTVTFDAQGGSVEPSDKLVAYDAPYGALPEPSRTGYAFSGWWTAANGAGTQVTEASTVAAAADHTLYAKWTASSNTGGPAFRRASPETAVMAA